VKTNLKAHIALLALMFFTVPTTALQRFSLPQYIHPAGYILIRVAASLALYIIFLLVAAKGQSWKIDRSDWLRFILCGITGVAVQPGFIFEGLARTSPVHAALILTFQSAAGAGSRSVPD
jgi:drug/metabolite transporter (DMT)-like permease